MKAYMKPIKLGLVMLMVAFLSMTLTTSAAQTGKNSEQVSGLLAEAKREAIQLKQDAEEMNSFVRSKTSWETHASKLREIKDHVNKLGELVGNMNNAKAGAAPWQQQSIDRITPLLADLAASVTDTIKHLTDNQHRLMHPPYPAYAAATAAYASDLAQLVSDDLAYGEAKHKSDELARELDEVSQK